jgi:hypothetical protein
MWHVSRLALLAVMLSPHAGWSVDPPPEKKYEDFDTVTRGAREFDGLLKLHLKDDRLYGEIRPDQFDRPFLLPIAIARGAGMGGNTLNFDEQWVIYFHRVGDRVQMIRRNVRFKANPGTPVAKAVETTYTDSVLHALRIVSVHPGRQSVLLNLNDIFMTDLAQLGLGQFDANRSTWAKVKAFPRNIEIEVAATYSGGRMGFTTDDSIIDSRGKTVVIHYGLCNLPEYGYSPRLADDRVGHFLSVVKDFSSDTNDSAFVRYVNRWRLERAEPVDSKNPNKLSAPKKKIVFWIEKSVPDEYRASVREGILEWNKAFEKIGFRDAIEVRQQENEEFDPEDINYNTFRWIATDQGFAMGPSRANPLTGEIIDADIIFDASMVRFYRSEYSLAKAGSPASTIQAARAGWNFVKPPLVPSDLEATPEAKAGWNEPAQRLKATDLAARHGYCQCGAHIKYELGMAALAMIGRNELKPGEKVPDELIQQAVKEVTMHEVGHTLGLRHNFKSSTMLKNEQLHDTNITRKQGLLGSVMDYAPVNLAPKGVKQGDYFTTTLGPYDYWAIEYAYRPLAGGTDGEGEKLADISKRIAEPGLDYATDEDLFTNSDPLVNQWDLGADPLKFARERVEMAEEMLKTVADKASDKGEGYQRVRQAFALLLNQIGNGAYLAASHVGGVNHHRDHKDDPNGREPMIPVAADKQREALNFLKEKILQEKSFQFSPTLLRKLAADRWYHWGNEDTILGPVEYPVNQRILSIQMVVLNTLTYPGTLQRIADNALRVSEKEKPLTLSELFKALNEGVFGDLDKPAELVSSQRRNLQRQYVKTLTSMVLGNSNAWPADARSLARFHLKQLVTKLDKSIEEAKKKNLDEVQVAHYDELKDRIARVLQASVQSFDH